jgi:hypothetical protein
MKKYPKVIKVKAISSLKLEILFENGEQKLYNVSKLINLSPFDKLTDYNFFKQVKVDENGYGIYWDDNLDLAESELFENSIAISAIELRS